MLDWQKKMFDAVLSAKQLPAEPGAERWILRPEETIAGCYEVRKLVSSDQSAQLFEAWDSSLERMVAIKVGRLAAEAPWLVRQARKLVAVNHDCVVGVHRIGQHRGLDYVVMDAVSGMLLAEQIADRWADSRGMPVDEVLEIAIGLADGLTALHRVGLFYPNLRAETVRWQPGGRLLFTGALVTDDHERRDLYALGLLVVELATGRKIAGNGVRVPTSVPDVCALRPELPTELAHLILELVAEDPSVRPSSADSVAGQLRVIRTRAQARPRRDLVTVLVVDDDADEVRGLWSRLRRSHPLLEVEAAANATDAIAHVRRSSPQLILFDLGLTGSMNGFELALYLQGAGDANKTQFIALVDETNERARHVLGEIGVRAVLERGPSLGDLLANEVCALIDELHRAHGAVTG